MQAENEALKRMVKEVMDNKAQAQDHLAGLRQHYNHLIEQVQHVHHAADTIEQVACTSCMPEACHQAEHV